MIKKLTVGLLFVTLILATPSAYAQDPEFTQFYANPLYLNPAFAGSIRCPRLTLNFRDQWPGLSGTFVTYAASYDQHVDQLQGGLGFMVMNDRQGQGTINSTRVSGIYSYLLNVNRNFSVKFGLEATYFQKSLDWSKLTFGDMIDSRYGFIYPTDEQQPDNLTSRGVDFSAGILGFSKKFFFGVAGHHLTQPQESLLKGDSQLPLKITAHGGAMMYFNDRKPDEGFISPNILFQYQGPKFSQLNLGFYVSKGVITGGLWWRNGDALIVSAGLHTDMFRFGYSYDITLSKLRANSAGSHEISFGIHFDCKPKKRKFRTVSCPSF
jgi:type IX secretion system PorP/SprF family membrane protein